MTLKSLSPLFLFGLLFWVLLSPSCKQENLETIPPSTQPPVDTTEVDNPVDTTDVDDPVEGADSIRYVPSYLLLHGAPANGLLLLDSVSNASLGFNIFSLSGSNVAINIFPGNCHILDNSTHGYSDALAKCTEINASGNWAQGTCLISTTVGSGGQFRGKNNRYLGVRIPAPQGGYFYGWVKLSVNGGGDLLTVSDFAFRSLPDLPILAGQKNLDVPCVDDLGVLTLIGNKSEILGNYKSELSTTCEIQIRESTDPAFDFTIQYLPFMWPDPNIPGRIVNGKLVLPEFSYSGNIPSPGGTDRPYSGKISGTGEMFVKGQTTTIVWQIQYDKTGFLSESYHGEFVVERCQ